MSGEDDEKIKPTKDPGKDRNRLDEGKERRDGNIQPPRDPGKQDRDRRVPPNTGVPPRRPR